MQIGITTCTNTACDLKRWFTRVFNFNGKFWSQILIQIFIASYFFMRELLPCQLDLSGDIIKILHVCLGLINQKEPTFLDHELSPSIVFLRSFQQHRERFRNTISIFLPKLEFLFLKILNFKFFDRSLIKILTILQFISTQP